MNTEKLYDLDAYETEFDATVLTCEKENDFYKVTLDKTLFFPEEGGQSADRGSIDGIEILNVTIKNDVIFHYLNEPLKPMQRVHGKIDFDHRFRNMQMHSGEHIFSGLAYKSFAANNVGFHLSENSATIDLDKEISDEDLKKLEIQVNTVIFENRNVLAYYPDKEELKKLNYRSKKELNGPVRIVIIDDADICACCAPHVKRTGEIGIFKIISKERYKGGIRLNYLCGFRALESFEKSLSDLKAISQGLNCKSGTEKERALELLSENSLLQYENISLKNKLIDAEIKAEFKNQAYGIKVTDITDSEVLRHAMKTLKNLYGGTCFLFAGSDEKGYRFLIESEATDAIKALNLLKEKYGAKGGGRAESIQGSFTGKIEPVLADIRTMFS